MIPSKWRATLLPACRKHCSTAAAAAPTLAVTSTDPHCAAGWLICCFL